MSETTTAAQGMTIEEMLRRVKTETVKMGLIWIINVGRQIVEYDMLTDEEYPFLTKAGCLLGGQLPDVWNFGLSRENLVEVNKAARMDPGYDKELRIKLFEACRLL